MLSLTTREIEFRGLKIHIRLFALNRNRALFAGHGKDAAAYRRIGPQVETAEMNDVEPDAFPHSHPLQQIHRISLIIVRTDLQMESLQWIRR